LGPGKTLQNLTLLIPAANQAGELVVPNPLAAAEELFGLWQGVTNYRILLGVDVGAVREDLLARVQRGVAVFLRAYSADNQSSGSA
jgi:TetR/AcrR family transcriptional repressor of mexJK operon